MPLFVHRLQLLFIASIVCLLPVNLVLAQSEPVTQVGAFTGIMSTQLLDIPVHGNSIVNQNFRFDGIFEVFDLEGDLRFSLDYDEDIISSRFHRFSFVEEIDLRNSGLAEVVFTLEDTDRNIHIRHFNERSELLYSEVIPASSNAFSFPYFFTDPVTQHGFLAYELFNFPYYSTLVYPFSSASTSITLAGRRHSFYPIYSGIPLVVYQRDDLLVGYDAKAQEVSRMEAKFGADNLTALYADFGRDGVLDAFSYIDTLIGGEDAMRAVWYDNEDNVYLDTIVMGASIGISSTQRRWLLPSEEGFHIANFSVSTEENRVELSFRSDNGKLIDANTYNPAFLQQVCLEGISYLATSTSNGNVDDTLYSARTGSVIRTLPREIFYEGQTADLRNVVGQCDSTLPESIVYAYSQPSARRLLFTDVDKGVLAEIPYDNLATAYRFDGSVYAISDIGENGADATAVYRIGEQVSNTLSAKSIVDITIAPNPARDNFQMLTDESYLDAGPLNIRVYNIDGQEVANYSQIANGQFLNTPSAPGIYIVQAVQPVTGHRVTKKLVVR